MSEPLSPLADVHATAAAPEHDAHAIALASSPGAFVAQVHRGERPQAMRQAISNLGVGLESVSMEWEWGW